jgi:hypothetical protein
MNLDEVASLMSKQTLNRSNELNVASNLTQLQDLQQRTSTKQEQQIKFDIKLDPMQNLQRR